MAKAYQPKKNKYNDLLSLHDEMIKSGVKTMSYDGVSIQTKQARYTLAHGVIHVREHSST
jgi:hypothetical protein